MEYKAKRPAADLFYAGDQLSKYHYIVSQIVFGTQANEPPILTVVIPTYRRPKQLTEAVQSVMQQSVDVSKYEILVIDNEWDNTSSSVEMIKGISPSNLVYYQNKENLGAIGNWNRGIELAKSDWVCMLHDDDVLYPQALSTVMSVLNQTDKRSTAAITFDCDYAHQVNGEWVCEVQGSRHFWWKYLQNRLIKRSLVRMQLGLYDYPVAPTCGATFNRRIVLEAGGFADQYKSDDLFFLCALSSQYDCFVWKRKIGQYRWADNDSLKTTTQVELIKESLMLHDYFMEHHQPGIIAAIDRILIKRMAYFLYAKPVLDKMDPIERKEVIASNWPDWRERSPNILQFAALWTRHKMALAYNLITTIFSREVN